MELLVQVLHFLTIVAMGISAGGLLLGLIVVLPLARSFPEEVKLRTYQMFDHLADRYMPAAVIIATISGVLILVLPQGRTGPVVTMTALGLVGSIGVSVVSLLFIGRVGRLMSGWSADQARREDVYRRWDRLHELRTALSTLALLSYTIAGLAM
jgi:hypothetical protein